MKITQSNAVTRSLSTKNFLLGGMGTILPLLDATNPESTFETRLFDSVLTLYSADVFNNYQCFPLNGATVTNLNPELATLSESLRLSRVSDGIGRVRFSLNGTNTEREYDTRLRVGENYPTFNRYEVGTIARYLEDQIMALVNSDPLKTDKAYFSTINHATGTYVLNPNCWCRAVDLSCLSVATGYPGSFERYRPGVLVTPRHVTVANHYRPAVGERLRFFTPQGILREVIVIGISGMHYDRCVMTLSEDVVGCSIAKIPGQWIYQETATQLYFGGMLLNTNRFKQCGICLFGQPDIAMPHTPSNGSYKDYTYSSPSTCAISWWKHPWLDVDLYGPQNYIAEVSPGTSGHPVFAIVDGKPVLMMQYLTANGGPAGWIGNTNDNLVNVQIIEADADAIARGTMATPTGYTVTVADDPII